MRSRLPPDAALRSRSSPSASIRPVNMSAVDGPAKAGPYVALVALSLMRSVNVALDQHIRPKRLHLQIDQRGGRERPRIEKCYASRTQNERRHIQLEKIGDTF